MKRKVLIFTYYFPPAGGVAVQRFLKFSKFLPEFGWEPIIVTVANGSYPYYDQSLLKELPDNLRIYRTKTFEPFEWYNLLRGKKGKSLPLVAVGERSKKSFFQSIAEFIRANFFIPDARKCWVPYAIREAEKILTDEKIDAIITTGPPHSTHLIGLQLKNKFGVKWLADFRDPWTKIFYNKMLPRTQATERKDASLEKKVLSSADRITVISPGLKESLDAQSKKISVIYNGYDADDFEMPADSKISNRSFTLRYVGNLMNSQNPKVLWQVIKQLTDEGHQIQLEFTGRVDDGVRKNITESGIEKYCRWFPFTDHHQAVRLMQTADLLLFVVPDVADNRLIVTGKLFEYLGSGAEVLAIGPLYGDAASILKEAGRKPIISYKDADTMRTQLNTRIEQYRQNNFKKYAEELHCQFTRKNQAGQLAELLDGLSK